MRRCSFFACLLVFSCFMPGCAGKVLDDPARLSEAKIQAEQSGSAVFWSGKPSRVTAYIQPESLSLFSISSVPFAFQSIYRTYPDGSTRFVMFMPQGTRLGSCERTPEGKLSCTSMPLPTVDDIVSHSFAAIESLLEAAPAPDDIWRLQYGDRLGGVDSDELVLVREHRREDTGKVLALYSLNGEPQVVYENKDNGVLWKMLFSRPSSEDSVAFYRYRDKSSRWIFNVNILGVE